MRDNVDLAMAIGILILCFIGLVLWCPPKHKTIEYYFYNPTEEFPERTD